MENRFPKLPQGLSGGLGQLPLLSKNAYQNNINHLMKNGMGKRTEGKGMSSVNSAEKLPILVSYK